MSSQPASYAVPALERGLDVLEALSSAGVGMTQAQIGRVLGRPPAELFRTLTTLERRGYLHRDPASGVYTLTLRLFTLAHTHSPYEALVRAAAGPMRQLSDACGHSCHLCTIDRDNVVVLATQESSQRVRVSVELGSTIAPHQSASGRVLLAAWTEPERRALLREAGMTDADIVRLDAHLADVRERGYETAYAESTEGVGDLSVPVGALRGPVQAALTVTGLPRDRAAFEREVLPLAQAAARNIARACGLEIERGEEPEA